MNRGESLERSSSVGQLVVGRPVPSAPLGLTHPEPVARRG